MGLLFAFSLFSSTVFAQTLSPADQNSIYGNTVWYKPNGGDATFDCSTLDNSTGGGSTSAPSPSQVQIAQIIMGIAKTDNLGQRGALIGLMVGIDESQLKILANTNVPISESNPAKQDDGSDHDSVGVFQQRPSTSWSTFAPNGGVAADNNKDAVWQLMDPAYSAEAFFGSPPGSNAPGPLSKGLQNVSGWQNMVPWEAAQKVQGSATADGSNYEQFVGQAQSLLNKYWDSSPAVPLPVPLNGGSNSNGGGDLNTGPICSTSTITPVSGNAQSLAQQILNNSNIDLDCLSPTVSQDVQAAAAGKVGTAGAMTSSAILQLIATVGQSHKVCVTAIQSGGQGHCNNTPKSACPNDPHYTGDAVDFGNLDGQALSGRDPGSLTIMNIAFSVLPGGSGFGQSQCGSTPPLPNGDITFEDTCDHLHVQVRSGTP